MVGLVRPDLVALSPFSILPFRRPCSLPGRVFIPLEACFEALSASNTDLKGGVSQGPRRLSRSRLRNVIRNNYGTPYGTPYGTLSGTPTGAVTEETGADRAVNRVVGGVAPMGKRPSFSHRFWLGGKERFTF